MKAMRISIYRKSTPLLVFEEWMESPSPSDCLFIIENAQAQVSDVANEKVISFKRGDKKIIFIRGEYYRRGKWAPHTVGFPTTLPHERLVALLQAMQNPVTLIDHTESWSNGGGVFQEYFIFETPIEGKYPLLIFIKKVSERQVRDFVLFSNGEVEDYTLAVLQGEVLDINKLGQTN